MARGKKKNGNPNVPKAETYRHTEADSLMRPEVGTQPQFRKKKPPQTYRYDSSLSPALDWDGQNAAREVGEWLLKMVEEAAALDPPHVFEKPRQMLRGNGEVATTVTGLTDAVAQLKRLSQPFLNWAGKAERLSFEVPTLPLFIHERLSTKGIIETLTGHRKPKERQMDLWGDPQRPVTDQILKAYEYRDEWVNRLILGDSLVVMNSLLHYEGLGGQVQMIYLDPPYGIKFGSNFQPFVRKRDVKHNDDEDLTREPEMVKAYRDTWNMGMHSYLTYLRDRLVLCRDLLSMNGSIFVQISDENVHYVRQVMDEVFGVKNQCATIAWKKASPESKTIRNTFNYLLWYGRDLEFIQPNKLFKQRTGVEGTTEDPKKLALWADFPDGTSRPLTTDEKRSISDLPEGTKIFRIDKITDRGATNRFGFFFDGREHWPKNGFSWRGDTSQMERLRNAERIVVTPEGLGYKFYLDDYPVIEITNLWEDTAGKIPEMIYTVQTHEKIVERCLLICTKPGDLVLDPTCGSGTTPYVSEQWGRRWIAVDVSRVPLALARQRLLTATFPYYELKDEGRGPASGFVYKRKQNKKGEEVGGIVPHVTLKSIANNEPPEEEVLVDRPEPVSGITRVSGPFCVEATIPAPLDWEGEAVATADGEAHGSYIDRMLEVLRQSPVLHLGNGKTVTLKNVRQPAKTLSLSAEARVDNGEGQPVAVVFGPENGAVSEKLVYEAAREAHGKGYYSHLYVIGFAIQPNARKLVEECEAAVGLPGTYVQATPDLLMGDLLKNMRSSQIFSVCGLPEARIKAAPPVKAGEPGRYQVELLGLDVFDPVEMKNHPRQGDDVPAWFLDTDYNGLCFHVCQAFFPRTGAWDNLKKALKGSFEESVWEHLAGTVSAPFEAGEHGQVAVKVIDDRGNELLVVKALAEAD